MKNTLQYLQNMKIPRFVIYACCTSILIVFFIIVYSHVFSSQLGTADDAYIAVAARNLAEGNGYATTVSFDGIYGIAKFSAGVTTGPTLVLPAALLIVFFGNQLWVPGFATATIILILLLIIMQQVRKQTNLTLAYIFSTVLIIFFYILTAKFHFASWYVLLGELPSSFLSILGIIYLAKSPQKLSSIILACFMFGLAFMTKMLSLLGFFPIIVWFVIIIIQEKKNRGLLFRNYLIGALAFAIPYLLFEIWKLFSLGVTAYFENWQSFINLFGRLSGAEGESSISLIELFLTRSESMSVHFGFTPLSLILVGMAVGFLIYRYSKSKYIKIIFTLLMLGALTHLLYWTFLSTGWYRYVLIGLFMYFAAIACVVFIKLPTPIVPILVVVLLLILSSPFNSLKKPVLNAMNQKFQYNDRLKNLQKTVSFLKDYEHNKPFISGWWASIVDVEYAMPELGNFKRFDQLNMSNYNKDIILVRNKHFTDFHHFPGYDEWEKKCDEVLFEAPPYIISRYKHDAKSLNVGNIIDFSESGNSEGYLIYGWRKQEKNFRWTNGRNAGLVISIPHKNTDSLEIRILGFGYLGQGKIKFQRVKVSVNNNFVGDLKLKKEAWHKVIVPAKYLSNNESVLIDFELRDAVAPATITNSQDKRMLGIGIKKIELNILNND